MNNEYFFSVAGLLFSVAFPGGWDLEALLPSFRPFRCEARPAGKRIFGLAVVAQPYILDGKPVEVLGESSNDLGNVRLLRCTDGYRVEIGYGSTMENSTPHIMTVDAAFSRATAYLRSADPFVGMVLASMLRILYAQAVLGHDGVSVHASCVCLQGRGYLFLGKSGTGKSTHARLWAKAFSGCSLLNDDNPVLRIEDGTLMVYGTPWSGKTPCYKNACCPVAGIVRLQQAVANRFALLDGPEAFTALLPSCSGIREDARLQDALYCTLVRVAELIPVGRLECLPDEAAARLCKGQLTGDR